MARTKQTIDDRIKKAEEAVIKTKEKYEAALEELNLLVKKKKRDGKQRTHESIREKQEIVRRSA